MLEHQQPFDSLLAGGASTITEKPGIHVSWICGAGFLLLQSPSESALQDALERHIGLPLPAPQAASARGERALLWLTPTEWLLGAPASETDSLCAALTRELATCLAAVTDVSDAWVACEVSGTRAAEALMSGCTLNLRADAFPAGRSTPTALADIPAILWNPGGEPDRFRCIVDRSYARHWRDWLIAAAGPPGHPATPRSDHLHP